MLNAASESKRPVLVWLYHRFTACPLLPVIEQIFDLRLLYRRTCGNHTWIAPTTSYTRHSLNANTAITILAIGLGSGTCGSTENKRVVFFWPIVSKHFWAESIEIFYATATFKVGGSVDLCILASSQQQSVRRMRNLVVKMGFGITHHNRSWGLESCANTIRNFEGLRGLTLLIGLGVDDNSSYTGTCISYSYDNGECSAAIGNNITRGSRMQAMRGNSRRTGFPCSALIPATSPPDGSHASQAFRQTQE